MIILGLCTHFTQTDEWAFDYAFHLVQIRGWQLNICHWLRSPYVLRRDIVQDDLFQDGEPRPITRELLNKLELQLREYYDPKLGDFTNVAFKLCEGQFQVELVRCLRDNQLDAIVMGYQLLKEEFDPGVIPLELFAQRLSYPLIIVGRDGPDSFMLNPKAVEWLDHLDILDKAYTVLEPLRV
jgi:hypothetical protein